MVDMRIEDARKMVIQASLTILQKGLIVGSCGNISLKIEKDCFAITPSGRNYDKMKLDDIVIINADGKKMMGERTPSSETKMHMAIYAANPRFKAIVHTHSTYATAVAAMRKPIPPLVEDMAHISGGMINVAPYAISGSEELAANAVAAMGDSNAVLLANHGAVSCGKTLEEALSVAELVEKSAQIYCITASMGGGFLLDEKNIKTIRNFYKDHYSKRQAGKEL